MWAQRLRIAENLTHAIDACEQELAVQCLRLEELKAGGGRQAHGWLARMDVGAALVSVFRGRLNRRAKQEAEGLLATAARDRQANQVKGTSTKLAGLWREKEALGDVEREYCDVFERRARAIAAQMGSDGKRVVELARQVSDAHATREEYLRAIRAGKAAVPRLDAALRGLGDSSVRSRLVRRIRERSRLDAVAVHVGRAQHLLHRFRRELIEANAPIQLTPDLGGLQRFGDAFFDGLIADWFPDRGIRDSRKTLEELRTRTMEIVEGLESEVAALGRRIRALTRNFTVLVHGS